MEAKIEAVLIRMGKKDVRLTPEEAKSLRDALVEMFPVHQPAPFVMPVPVYPWPQYPIWYGPWCVTGTDVGGIVTVSCSGA